MRGVVVADGANSAILDAGDALPLRPIIGAWGLHALIEMSGGDGSDEDDAAGEGVGADDALGYFGSTTPLRHGEAAALGAAARARLALAADDRACVADHAVPRLRHRLGGVRGARRGAAVVLPAVGGIRGCGVPSQRAQVTREVGRGRALHAPRRLAHAARCRPATAATAAARRQRRAAAS